MEFTPDVKMNKIYENFYKEITILFELTSG